MRYPPIHAMKKPSRKWPSPPGVPPTSLMERFSMRLRIADGLARTPDDCRATTTARLGFPIQDLRCARSLHRHQLVEGGAQQEIFVDRAIVRKRRSSWRVRDDLIDGRLVGE